MNLLKVEWRKLLPYRAFWLALSAYGLLMPALFISLHNFQFKLGNNGTELSISFYNFPDVWHNVAYISSWFNILLYFFVILLVGNEYQYKTFRQNIIDGMSRSQALFSKILLMFLFALGSTLLVSALGFLCGYYLGDVEAYPVSFDKVSYMGLYFLQVLGYMSLAFFITHALRKQGMSIVAFLLYAFVAEPVLQYKVFKDWIPLPQVADHLPIQALGKLIPNPLPAYFGIGETAAYNSEAVVTTLVYIAVFLTLSYGMVRSRDL